MATAYITEYRNIGIQQGNVIPVAAEPAIAEQTVSFTTTTQSAAFNAQTRFVRITSDAECHMKFGADPTATTSTQQVQADTVEWRMVEPGHKVAFVTAA